MTDAAGMEQDDRCQGCGRLPALYCPAWAQFLCASCRYSRTEHEIKDGGLHPVWDQCACLRCKTARRHGISDGTWKPV